jgi:carboxylesterase
MRSSSIALAAALGLASCSPSYPFVAADLDSGQHPDTPNLISRNIPNPSPGQLTAPVVITAHGFGATTYETQAVAQFLSSNSVQVSQVLLGGHGTSLADFSTSNWQKWQAPMLAEYQALAGQGYQNLSVLGTSTGGTLWLEALSRGLLKPAPKRIIMVSPILEFGDRRVGYAPLLSWVGMKKENTLTGTSPGHWYRFDPVDQLNSLVDLTEVMKGRLRQVITIPTGTKVLIVQGDQDGTADASGANEFKQGMFGSVTLDLFHSSLHVPIRFDGIDSHVYTTQEAADRTRIDQEILAFVTS